MMSGAQAQTILELRRRGYIYADIAAHTGSSINTVKSYCLRNRDILLALDAKEICKQCGAALPQRTGAKRRSFCCDRCRLAWWAAHRDLLNRTAVYQFTCPHCGCNFKAYGNSRRKFCSRDCAYAARRGENSYDA